ncbi:MAG: hypothetical protein OWR52_03710 [Acidibacillus sp.]|nr:hypothetical protein [Acidibacillus sp.]
MDGDYGVVQLRTHEQPVRIAMKDLIYWDDEDETWIMAPSMRDDA